MCRVRACCGRRISPPKGSKKKVTAAILFIFAKKAIKTRLFLKKMIKIHQNPPFILLGFKKRSKPPLFGPSPASTQNPQYLNCLKSVKKKKKKKINR
jgi:hypothetical protein